MKIKLIVAVLIASSLTGLKLSAQDIPGIPVFGDDFSTVDFFAENWESTKGTKSENGQVFIPWKLPKNVFNRLTLRRIPKGDFAFSSDVIIKKPEGPESGMFVVKLDGWINLLISVAADENRANAHTTYRVQGEKNSRGKRGNAIPEFKFGKTVKIVVSREEVGESYKYAYKVNGLLIDSFIVPANKKGTGQILFSGHRTSVSLDNFQLYTIKGNGSNNLIVNSSFEHLQEGMPLYLRPGTIGKYRFQGEYKDFMNAFSIDKNEKTSGKQSIKMTMDERFPGVENLTSLPSKFFKNGVWTHDVGATLGKPVTFSVYLKASENDFPVRLTLNELRAGKSHSQHIKISTKWQRYSVIAKELEKKGTVKGIITFSHSGTVWADDLQIEIGDKATKYMPSSLDKDKFADTKETTAIEEDTILRKTTKAPVIDGNIEEVWFKNGVKIDNFFINGSKKPINKTEAWITCDDDNLYLAVRAYVLDTSKVKNKKYAHDILSTHSQDCIEVFLDTTSSRKNYYHLTVNAGGAKTDFGPGKTMGWNGKWEAKTRINEKEKSIDYEMQFPLESFAGLDIAGKWGLNIGRNDTASKQYPSRTHTTEVNFHVPAIFPAIVLPDRITEKYKVGIKKLNIVSGKNDEISVTGIIGNLSGKVLDSEIQILNAATGKVIGDKKISIKKGNTELSLPVTGSPNVKALDVIVKIVVDGKERFSQSKRMTLARILDLYTRYNYYMDEPNAVLVGSLNLPDTNKLTGKLTVAGKTIEVIMASEFALDVPLKGIEYGEHQIILDVYKGTEKLVSGTAKLIKRKFKKGATQIDHQRRCLIVDGKPYLVIMPHLYVGRSVSLKDQDKVLKNTLRFYKEMGYKCLLGTTSESALYSKHKNFFYDLCAKEGIKVINWSNTDTYTDDTKTAFLGPEITFSTVTNENIIAWMILDEPELGKPSNVSEAYLVSHQKASPYTPVFMNNTILGIPRRYANLETDILMLDDYLTNREGRKVVEMIDATEVMVEAAEEGRKPSFFFLISNALSVHYREITYAEQVAQSYGVIIAGARGIGYFMGIPQYPEDYRACVDVNRELLELEEVIFSLEKTSKAKATDFIIKSMTKKLNGKMYIIALNSDNDRAADVEITLPVEFTYADTAKVKFEGRTVKVKNGKITAKFKALERHVYVIDIVK